MRLRRIMSFKCHIIANTDAVKLVQRPDSGPLTLLYFARRKFGYLQSKPTETSQALDSLAP